MVHKVAKQIVYTTHKVPLHFEKGPGKYIYSIKYVLHDPSHLTEDEK